MSKKMDDVALCSETINKRVGDIRRMYYALVTKTGMDLDVDARMKLIKEFCEHTEAILKASYSIGEATRDYSAKFAAVTNFCMQYHDNEEEEEE